MGLNRLYPWWVPSVMCPVSCVQCPVYSVQCTDDGSELMVLQVKSSGSRFNALFTGTVGEGQRASTTHTHLLLNRVSISSRRRFPMMVIVYE